MAKDSLLSRRLRGALSSALVAGAIALGTAATASAQITFAGVTTYAFNANALTATATVHGLSVTQDGFNVITTPLFPGISQAGIGGTGNNLGRVSLTSQRFSYINIPFRMQIAFTSPTTANQLFFANVLGSVNGNRVGGVTFTFNPSTISNVPFSNGPGSGTYSLTVNNTSVNAGQQNAQLTGTIVAVTPSPEPASLVLLGTGLVGVFGVAARRRNLKA